MLVNPGRFLSRGAGAGGGNTVRAYARSGALSWAGLPPAAVGGTRIVSPGVAAVEWSGLQPTPASTTINVPAYPGFGVLSWAGLSPSVAVYIEGLTALAGVAQASWSGSAPAVRIATTPSSGVAAWFGHQPNVAISENFIVAATGVGVLTWAGAEPFVTANTTLTRPGVGSLAWAGAAPAASTITSTAHVGAGAVTWTGLAPTAALSWLPTDLGADLQLAFDPSRLTKVWADSSETTQASIDGTVVTIKDLSTNANDGVAGSGFEPILRSSGGLYYLETDGVDDTLVLDAPIVLGDNYYIGIAMKIPGALPNLGAMTIGGGPTAGGVDYRGYIWHRGAPTNYTRVYHDGGTSGTMMINAAGQPVFADGAGHVLSVTRTGQSNMTIRKDGVQIASTASAPSAAFTIRQIGWTLDQPTYSEAMHIYGVIIASASIGATEIANAEAWLASKAGVTLA